MAVSRRPTLMGSLRGLASTASAGAGVSLPPPQASGSWAHSHLCCPSGAPREHHSQGPGHLGVLRLPEPRTPLAQVCECIGRESNPGHIDGNDVFYH